MGKCCNQRVVYGWAMRYDSGMSPAGESVQPRVMSREFLRRAVRIPASPDPDTTTVQTVQEMVRQIHTSALDPVLQNTAVNAVAGWAGGPAFGISGRDPFSDPAAIAESFFWWAKHNLRFVHHSKQIYALLGERDQLQLLISPDVLVRMKRMEGDCAIYTMVMCAMLEALGVPFEICTVAVNPFQPSVFSHVFARVVLPDGRRIPLDASHGKYFGWRVPDQDILRSQVWSADGSPAEDVPEFSGLNGYRVNPNPWWSSGFGSLGLGQDETPELTSTDVTDLIGSSPLDMTGSNQIANSLTTDSTASLANVAASIGVSPTLLDSSTTYNPSTGLATTSVSGTQGYVAPTSSSTAAWAAFAAQLAKSGMTLAEINSIQPGTVVSANGAILRQAAGLPVPVGSSLTASLGANSSSYLMIGGVVIAGLVAVSMLKK